MQGITSVGYAILFVLSCVGIAALVKYYKDRKKKIKEVDSMGHIERMKKRVGRIRGKD